MKCAELLTALNEYVDGTVDPANCEEFEAHMAGCNPCRWSWTIFGRPSRSSRKAGLTHYRLNATSGFTPR